jgi:hypothetical protein
VDFLYHLYSNESSECITIKIEDRYVLLQIGVALFGLIFNIFLADIPPNVAGCSVQTTVSLL